MASGKILLFVLISNVNVLFGVDGESCEPNHTIPHPHNPTMFYICDAEGSYRLFSCPEGLHFDPSKPGCDQPSKAEEEEIEGYETHEVDEDHIIDHPVDEMTYEVDEDHMLSHPVDEMTHEVDEDRMIDNPLGLDEMTHEVSNSDLPMENYEKSLNVEDHENSDVEEQPETVHEDHFLLKRESYDPEIDDGESLHSSTSNMDDSHSIYDGNSSLPDESGESNTNQSDILKVKDVLLSFYYLLSAYPESQSLHGENKTDFDYYHHLGYYTNENNSSSGEVSPHEPHGEGDSTAPEDVEEKSQPDEEESPVESGFPQFYK